MLRFMALWLVFAAATSIPLADAASARSRYSDAPEKKQRKTEEPAPPAAPLFFVISLRNQHVSVYSSDGLYARSPVSTGQPGHPTPRGIFSIIGKERMHHSNIYSGAPMPYMQRITWSGVAMHQGVVPGYPASHGCIRLPYDFAKRMFSMTQGNERVIISRQDIAPAPFAHPKLPAPALLPEPDAGALATISNSMLHHAMGAAEGAGSADGLTTTVAAKAEDAGLRPDGAARKRLNPHEFAKAMRALAAKKAEGAAVAASPARAAIEAKAREVSVAAVELKKAQIALSNAKDRLESVERRVGRALKDGGEENVKKAAEAKTEAEAKVAEAGALVEAALRAKSRKDDELAATVKALKDLDAAQKAAADGVKSWTRRLSPVSVFISRKTQRLYVRQNFIQVFDVPVTIRDPEKPLGTHLFMAIQPAAGEPADAPKLRWLALTIPEAAAKGDRSRRRHSRYYDDEDENAPLAAPASAAAALDRIEVPAEVSRKISEMLWAGSSIIVSDSGISEETDDYSDFAILTR
ncbi:MAG: L,D-transpeptidase family protein [Rhodomicrobium sp.]